MPKADPRPPLATSPLATQWHPHLNGTLRPEDLTLGSGKRVWWRCDEGDDHVWEARVSSRALGRGCPFCAGYRASAAYNLALAAPTVAAQWHPTRNGDLTPQQVTPSAGTAYWWLCPAGPDHEWQVRPGDRIKRDTGCPFCAGKRASVTNSLGVVRPDLAAEWHPDRNGGLTPDDVIATSCVPRTWRCHMDDGHVWEATPANRSKGRGRCPECPPPKQPRRKARRGNLGRTARLSLAQAAPELVTQWHPTLNGTLDPHELLAGSSVPVWWTCPEGPDHVWRARPTSRVRTSTGCPFCCNRLLSITNALSTVHPAVAAEWHPTRNPQQDPGQVNAFWARKAWWRCPEGPDHEWEASIRVRAVVGSGCPFCAGRAVSVTNNLPAVCPGLAAQWHPTRNGDLRPDQVTAGTARRVWWQCAEGADHQWRARINDRYQRAGCPVCAGRTVVPSTSLATLLPDLAEEWDRGGNGQVTPDDVTPGSSTPRWWRCRTEPTHRWEAAPVVRAAGHGCPFCTSRAVHPSTSLAAQHPRIAETWHPTLNGELSPGDVLPYSATKVWWQCRAVAAHTWEAQVSSRHTSGCPHCWLAPRSAPEILLAHELRAHVDFDVDDHKVRLPGKARLADVDICLRESRVVVEYDGSYWHARKERTDRDKTAALVADGWTVIRVREAPLAPVGPADVCIAVGDVKAAASGVLDALAASGLVASSVAEEYGAQPGLVAEDRAREYIDTLLKRRAQAAA